MDEDFLKEVDRVRLGLELYRDDHRRSGETAKAAVYVRALSSIEDVRLTLKAKVDSEPKPGVAA